MVRRAAIVSLVLAAVLAATGCGGSSGDTGGQNQHRSLTAEDLLGIVPTPSTPDGANYNLDDHSASLSLDDYRSRATTTADKEMAGALGKAGLSRIYQRSFAGALNQADASVFLFRDAAGADTGFKRLRSSLERPGAVDQKVAAVEATGLGTEAWGAHLTGSGSDAGLFLWRNGNVVVVSDMQCDDSCDFDVIKAVQAFAAQIDDLVDQSSTS
jgi:hypothetical protein